MTRNILLFVLLILFTIVMGGCHHHVAFDDIGYDTGASQHDAGVVVVIDPYTLDRTVSIRSFMTGIAHSWDAKPGLMLKQVADVEFPQLFKHYEVAESYREPMKGKSRLTLKMTVPHFTFADFKATITVRAVGKAPGGDVLFDHSYSEQGISQGGKMFWAGAFGMKSAVRQSSFDAYKKIFAALRTDIVEALQLETIR